MDYGESLNIDPGVVIRFEKDKVFYVKGELKAVGTSVDSIVFTSNQIPPQIGDWRGLFFDYTSSGSSENSILQYCVVKYIGHKVQNAQYSGVWCNGLYCKLKILDCSICDATSGISCTDADVEIRGCKLNRCKVGLKMFPATVSLFDCYFQNMGEGTPTIRTGGAICILGGNLLAENNSMVDCIYAISARDASLSLRNNKFKKIGYCAILAEYLYADLKCDIMNNTFEENGWLAKSDESCIELNLVSYWTGSASIINNVLYKNRAGMDFTKVPSTSNFASIEITNNTISNNIKDGIKCGELKSLLVLNNIISQNGQTGIYFNKAGDKRILYNNVYSNLENFGGTDVENLGLLTQINTNGDSCDNFFNINLDPLFQNPNSGNFHLEANSSCIDAGHPQNQYYDPEDPKNPGYALLPALGTIINDMGAYGGPYAASWYVVTAVEYKPEELAHLPKSLELFQNYPNPFNPTTTIKYQLPKSTEVSLKIYNLLGQLVRILIDEKQMAGNYSIIWDGKNDNGQLVTSGVYMCRIQTQNFVKTKKMILIR